MDFVIRNLSGRPIMSGVVPGTDRSAVDMNARSMTSRFAWRTRHDYRLYLDGLFERLAGIARSHSDPPNVTAPPEIDRRPMGRRTPGRSKRGIWTFCTPISPMYSSTEHRGSGISRGPVRLPLCSMALPLPPARPASTPWR